jgi:hypothetical protein
MNLRAANRSLVNNLYHKSDSRSNLIEKKQLSGQSEVDWPSEVALSLLRVELFDNTDFAGIV